MGKFALDVATKVLPFFSDYFGIKYPIPKLDLVAVPDFSMGAMEVISSQQYANVIVEDLKHRHIVIPSPSPPHSFNNTELGLHNLPRICPPD